MATQPLSAGVYITTTDKTTILSAVNTSIGAIVGYSTKGDINDPVTITNKDGFIQEFGKPVIGTPLHYMALAFLKWGSILKVQRVVNGALYGGLEIKTSASSEANAAYSAGEATPASHTFGTDGCLAFYAKDPGTWNNAINIKITNVDDTKKFFDVVVSYPNDDGTDVVVETFTECSRQEKLDGFGTQSYVEDKLEGSLYVRVLDNTLVADTVSPKAQATNLEMAGGTNGSAITDSQITVGWDKFADQDAIEVNLLINGGYATTTVQNYMIDIAETRDDCFCIFDMPYADDTAAEMLTYRNTTWNPNTSTGAVYAPWVLDYDQYSNKTLPLAPSGYVASQYAYNDSVGYTWTSPAGPNRGVMPIEGVVVKLEKEDRDQICPYGINPIVDIAGQGKMIYWDNTLKSNKSAFSYVSIVRMLLELKAVFRIALRSGLFENNTVSTRLSIEQLLNNHLKGVQAKGGLEDFLVVVDETNNGPDQRETGVLIIDNYLKPVYPIRAIQLNVIATKLSVDFNTLLV